MESNRELAKVPVKELLHNCLQFSLPNFAPTTKLTNKNKRNIKVFFSHPQEKKKSPRDFPFMC